MLHYGTEAIKKTRQIIEYVAGGGMVSEGLELIGLDQTTFNKVVLGDSEVALLYSQARESRADIDADMIVEISERNGLDPQRARNMIDARKWRATKQHPRVYGDRIDLTVTGTVSISETLTLARARLVPRPEQDIIDVKPEEDVPTSSLEQVKQGGIFS